MKTTHGFNISTGNETMGKVYSFSTMPIATCASDIPCARLCYVRTHVLRYPSVRKNYDENTRMLKEGRMYNELVEDLKEFMDKPRNKKVELFRWSVAGDMFSTDYYKAMCKTAIGLPHISFWTFTKQFDILRECLKIMTPPKNLTIILSQWNDFRPPVDLKDVFGVAYYDDGTHGQDIPKDGFVC